MNINPAPASAASRVVQAPHVGEITRGHEGIARGSRNGRRFRGRGLAQSRQSYSRHPAGSTAAGCPKLMRPRPRKSNSSRSSSTSGSSSTVQ